MKKKTGYGYGYSSEPLIYDKIGNQVLSYYQPGTSGDLKNTDIYQITPTPGHDSLWMADQQGAFSAEQGKKCYCAFPCRIALPVALR
jgi:hypothetical protein